jgi:hypothetical protein
MNSFPNLPPLPPLGASLPAVPRAGYGTRRTAYKDPPETPFKFREPPLQKTLAEWADYIGYVEDQVTTKVKNNANIPSLACAYEETLPRKITYAGSNFDDVMLREILEKYVKPIRVMRTNESLTQHPSFLRIFKSDVVNFWPHVLVYHNAQMSLKHIEGKNASLQSGEFADKLFDGEYDADLRAALQKDPKLLESIGSYTKEFTAILTAAEEKPVAISSFVSEHGKFHATAGMVYKSHGKFFYGVYDPIYHVRAGKSYVWPVISTYVTVKLVAESLRIDITLLNLSGFCLRGPKGIHCPQYLLNAEYCLYYSLYFLYTWARSGAPKGIRALKDVVEKAYIVKPAELRRDPCVASKRFRLVSIGFIFVVLLVAVETPDLLLNVTRFDGLIQADGFDVIHPDLRPLLPVIKGFTVLEGGKRVTRKTRRGKRARV